MIGLCKSEGGGGRGLRTGSSTGFLYKGKMGAGSRKGADPGFLC